VARVRAEVRVPGRASEVEALWYDPRRWPTFVDGLAHVEKVVGAWPDVGARVVWTSAPGGRGRVVETSVRHIARMGQTVEIEDERARGTQTVRFTPDGAEVVVALELEFALKQRTPVTPLVEAVLARRPQREALERTLRRFAVELRAEREA
jgi:hypothetical protein